MSGDAQKAACRIHGEAFTYGCPGCADYADDLAIAAEVRARDAADTGERITVEELAEEMRRAD